MNKKRKKKRKRDTKVPIESEVAGEVFSGWPAQEEASITARKM
jgi:hypothetical protein